MELLGGLIIVLGFLGLAKAFGLVDRNLKVIEITRSAASVVSDNNLDDLHKEKALQKHAGELLILLFLIIAISALSIGIPLGFIWLLDSLNLLSFDGVIKTIASTWFILASVAITLFVLFLNRRRKGKASEHTQGERTLHGLVFEPWFPRVPLSKVESRLYKNQLAAISIERPVFITALPRAGTTLLLEICVGVNEFVSHAYRDMPFLLSPLLWNRLSKGSRDPGSLSERVHGDGILVNVDSPESFEEVIWKEFWPSYYKKERILLWTESPYPAFEAFFFDHIRKIILLRSGEEQQARYISKNNLNIARIKYLGNAFPDSTILILYRSPLQQASSLLKQHRNFLNIHREDSFAQKYMEDTGHFDFGENLRPVDFNGWLSKAGEPNPNTLSFWLLYWVNAYRYLLNGKKPQARFFSYDAFCADPQSGLEKLGRILDIKNSELLMANVKRIAAPKPHNVETDDVPSSILDQAEDLYLELQNADSP